MKQVADFIITAVDHFGPLYSRLRVTPATDGAKLPAIYPGQFVQIAVETPGVFLRRPISINDVDNDNQTIDLLIRRAGKGTSTLVAMKPGDKLNILLPLGNGFNTEAAHGSRLMLIGGGVGVAPLLYLGRCLKALGFKPEFLLGARSVSDLLELDEFCAVGTVHVSTEDGTMGERGLVTQHSSLSGNIDRIYCCGPSPMMKAVATIAKSRGIDCEVSLENMMACGLGACLCCVENTVKGNVCVCTEGPVFNINLLNW